MRIDLLFSNDIVLSRKYHEVMKLEKSIRVEKDKQKTHLDHMGKRNDLLTLLKLTLKIRFSLKLLIRTHFNRLALQHMLDVLRHVGAEAEAFKDLEYPSADLKLPLLKFNSNLPPTPLSMETNGKIFITNE